MHKMILTAAFVACFAVPAFAHSWYTGKTDPVTKVSCCGGTDCAPISADDVREVSGGYVYLPTGEFIEHARVQPAHDWEFHRCVFLQDQMNWETGEILHRKGATRCFFAPPGSM